MSFLWGIIGVLLAFVAIATIFDIVRQHYGGGKTAAWILLVVLLPILGTIAYWALRVPTDREVQHNVDADQEARRRTAGPPPTRLGR